MKSPADDGEWAATSRALTAALMARDRDTADHSHRVRGLAGQLGMACQLSTSELRLLDLGAQLHDIGKLGTPDAVLLKPGKLDPAERACMQEHSALGARIILEAGFDRGEELAGVVRHHHESFDGSGYPDGLAGLAIPVESRLIAIADTYDAIGSERPYRGAQPHHVVLDIMEEGRGSHTDPDLYKVFLQVIEHSEFRFE